LGERFVAEVEEATRRLARISQAFATHETSGLRKCMPPHFPSTRFFLEEEERI
jgi:hypothetical protein